MKTKIIVLFLFLPLLLTFSQEWEQTFLSLKQTGVEEFIKTYPEYDGRGTIIFILDTGVDFGIDGLKETSTGEVKMIDVQDFTHEGDIPLYDADTDEEDGKVYFVNEDNDIKVSGADKLTLKSTSGDYLIGALDEKLWLNSSSHASDVNGNGTTDDKFAIVVFEAQKDSESFWVAYFDTNGDGDLSDEKPIRNYRENYDSFQIPNEEGLSTFTFGLNIFPEEKLVSLHFDDGAHGTHCAGIAAGYRIGGNPLNGVAPGAKLISLKLGNNNYSGGSTVTESMKNAYLYADKISKERKEPCIINMSFGIGSEIEGHAEIEKFINDLVKDNPYLYICISNGNEGPGISSTGLPAASPSVLSSGAVLTKEVGGDLYGASLDKDIILYFSSRGGEVPKPDIVSPGACTSTVPNWQPWDRFWGTSMASPYSTGVVSLLLSAASAEYPDVKIPSGLLFKVIRESATKWDGYSYLDQGSGFINVMNAYKLLKKYIDHNEVSKYESYSVTAFAPNMPSGRSSSLYIRNGEFINGTETFTFSVKRNNFINKKKFYRIYNLKSDSDWLVPIQKNTYLRNDQSTGVSVKFDISKMKKPGLYNGKIFATRADKSKIPEFELMATVVIPYEFNYENNFKTSWEGKVAPGMFKRYFINIPPGATAMKIKMSSPAGIYTSSKYRLHDPDGKELDISKTLRSFENEDSIDKTYYNLDPGIYELVATGYFLAKDSSYYKLSVEFDGINRNGNKELSENNNFIEVTNMFNKLKQYKLNGKILGYEKHYEVNFDGNDKKEIDFVLNKDESRRTFKISLSKDDFEKITDFAFMIYDENGVAVSKDALSYKEGELSVINNLESDSVNYKFVLLPAFANKPGTMKVHINEVTEFMNAPRFSTEINHNSSISLFPSITEKIYCGITKPSMDVPSGSKVFGKIYFAPKAESGVKLEIPVYFKF